MYLSMNEVFVFMESTPSSRNFVEGEKIINAGHLIYCGIKNQNVQQYEILSYCLQSSAFRDKPHEITTIINKKGKKIDSSKCSCTAGLSERCKHVAAVLIFCTRNDLSQLKVASSTDKKCLWSGPQKACLEQYDANPLSQHKCYQIKESEQELPKDVQDQLRKIIFSEDLKSALSEHVKGRHAPLTTTADPVAPDYLVLIENLFKHQSSSKILPDLSKTPYKLQDCCQNQFDKKFDKDPYNICIETKKYVSIWQKERRYRVTGSRCYALFTYNKNLKADWKTKSLKYFNCDNDKYNRFTSHGIKFEPIARKVYEEKLGIKVFQCGLIISRMNPWLGYSPDGIVFENNVPVKLIEIKCPYLGKTTNIDNVIQNIDYIIKDRDNNLLLKKKHTYYAQIQFGMALLNLSKTDFILFASFDKSIKIITVEYDTKFVEDLLLTLRSVFFHKMLHYLCTEQKTT